MNRVIAHSLYLEFPNKKHLAQWFRFFFRRDRSINIFSEKPEMRNSMFLNFSLEFIRSRILNDTIFSIERIAGLSYLRQDKVKRVLPMRFLMLIENILQHIQLFAPLAPSMLLSLSKKTSHAPQMFSNGASLLACPTCLKELSVTARGAQCENKHSFHTKDGVLDLYVE